MIRTWRSPPRTPQASRSYKEHSRETAAPEATETTREGALHEPITRGPIETTRVIF